MNSVRNILILLFLVYASVYAEEIDQRIGIEKYASQLIESRNFQTLSDTVKQYLDQQERLPGGRWKAFYLYQGIYRAFDTHNKNERYWDDNEAAIKTTLKKYPNDPVRQITYAIFLIKKGWLYRGRSYAKNVSKENWERFSAEIDKAVDYLVAHKDVGSKDPNWYVVMLDLARFESWDRNLFFMLVSEALSKYPDYYPIYHYALMYMDPKWNNYSAAEVEDIGRKILNLTNDKDGAYARYYWMVNDILLEGKSPSDLDIDWKAMKKCRKSVV